MSSFSFRALPARSTILCITELCYHLDTQQSHCCLDIKTAVSSPEPSEKKSLRFTFIRTENNYFLYPPKHIKLTVKFIPNMYHNKNTRWFQDCSVKPKLSPWRDSRGTVLTRYCGGARCLFATFVLRNPRPLRLVGKFGVYKKVFGISQLGFRKGRSCLINLIAFYSEMDWLSGWWKSSGYCLPWLWQSLQRYLP